MPHRVKGRHKPRHHTHADKPIRPLPQPGALKTPEPQPVSAAVPTVAAVPDAQVSAAPVAEETAPAYVTEEIMPAAINEGSTPASIYEESIPALVSEETTANEESAIAPITE